MYFFVVPESPAPVAAAVTDVDEVVVVLRTVVTADRPAVDDEAQAATSAPLIATRASDRSTRNGPIAGSI